MADAPKKTREELLAARAAREAQAAKDDEAHELLVLELEDRFSSELGKRGVAFEIANEDNAAGAGPIVVKPAEPVTFKAFQAKSGATLEDTLAFVTPSVVYPSREIWTALAVQRQSLLYRAAAALMTLHGASKETFRQKP